MTIRFTPMSIGDIQDDIRRHLMSLPSPVDSFVEDHITASVHFQIRVDDQIAGFTSIHKENLITQYALNTAFKHDGQRIYREVKRLETVQAALVSTGDEFFLSHALDEYRQLAKQAYFFAADPDAPVAMAPSPFALRLAEQSDIETIREGSGDFFGEIETYLTKHETYIAKHELFLTLSGETCVGFGVMDRGELCPGVASIGMFIIKQFRRQGAGTATLRLLQDACRREGLRPMAGCWYYNHLSKKTLERAGMYTQTRLLRIEY